MRNSAISKKVSIGRDP